MGQLDLVLRELESVNALLADLAPAGDGRVVEELRERLVACVSALGDVETDARHERDEFVAALENERRRYQELFELAPVAYLVTNGAGAILEANAAAGDVLGTEPRHLEHKPLIVFVARDERQGFRRLLRDLGRGAAAGEHEFTLVTRRRTFEAALTVAHAYGGSRGRALRWLIQDVSERGRAMEEARRFAAELEQRVRDRTYELERERALLETVVEQMPAGLTITDAETGRLLIANAQAWEIARGRFEPTEGLDPLLRALSDRAEGRSVLETLGPDGAAGSIEVSVAPLHERDGRVSARVAVFQDVTDRERLERAEREFVTNAAHELQTPLTAITSAAEVLQAGAKHVPDDRDRFLTHIQRECDRLARLVRALLVLARAQSQGQVPDAERLVLRPLLDEVAATLRPVNGVAVEVSCAPRLAVTANRELTEQALASIAGNAAKFTAGGTIRLTARRLDRERVAVEVTDTGPGIAPEERELVRQRFYRGGGRDRSGFGLGLAIAHQAAHALRGSLELELGPEGGTRARLVLPSGSGR